MFFLDFIKYLMVFYVGYSLCVIIWCFVSHPLKFTKKLISFILILCSLWPAFVPVHDPSRNAYIGIQNMGTVFTRRFEADRIGSQVPIKLMHLEGLYELFISKFVSSLSLSLSLCSNVFSKLCILSRSSTIIY